jgi:hypothetical protein
MTAAPVLVCPVVVHGHSGGVAYGGSAVFVGDPATDGAGGRLAWRSLDAPRLAAIQDQLPFEDPRHSHAPGPRPRDTTFERQPTATAQLPPADAFAARLAVAAVEVAAGARPATQLMRHCAPRVFESLVRRQAHRAGRLTRRPAVALRRVRVCHVRDGVVEAAVIVVVARRVRPVAVRLEGLDGRWLVTALEMG